MVVPPFEFALTEPGVGELEVALARAEALREAVVCTRAGRVLVRDLADPDGCWRLGVERLHRYVGSRR